MDVDGIFAIQSNCYGPQDFADVLVPNKGIAGGRCGTVIADYHLFNEVNK